MFILFEVCSLGSCPVSFLLAHFLHKNVFNSIFDRHFSKLLFFGSRINMLALDEIFCATQTHQERITTSHSFKLLVSRMSFHVAFCVGVRRVRIGTITIFLLVEDHKLLSAHGHERACLCQIVTT